MQIICIFPQIKLQILQMTNNCLRLLHKKTPDEGVLHPNQEFFRSQM